MKSAKSSCDRLPLNPEGY